METKDIVVGRAYMGTSGCKKKVMAITGDEGKVKTVTTEIVQQGTGKGQHRPVGTTGKLGLTAFAKWAIKECC